MSNDELIAEYNADLRELQRQTLIFADSAFVGMQQQKYRKFKHFTLSKFFKTNRRNRYLGILIFTRFGSGQTAGWEWSSFYIGLMQTLKGTAAIAFYADCGQALRFTPHFFNRYKERFSLVCDWRTRNRLTAAKSPEAVIAIYIRRNLATAWIETQSVFRDKVHIFAPVNDGVTLIQWDKSHDVLQANTFVTMDMLDLKQTKMVQMAKTYLALPKNEQLKYKFPDFITSDESNATNNSTK